VLLLLSAMTIFPLSWMLLTSLRPPNAIVSADLLQAWLTLDNYVAVWREIPIARMLLNTLLMSLLVTDAQMSTSLLAAYAFAGWTFPGSRVLFLLFVGTWLVPIQVTMIPNYVLLARLGRLKTLAAMVVPQFAAAFAIILLRQYVKAFPRELLQAARIDGASSWRTLLAVVVPKLRAPLGRAGDSYFHFELEGILLASAGDEQTRAIGHSSWLADVPDAGRRLVGAAHGRIHALPACRSFCCTWCSSSRSPMPSYVQD
jgi:ABC-type glycerol-3-phosphate transport system permease component